MENPAAVCPGKKIVSEDSKRIDRCGRQGCVVFRPACTIVGSQKDSVAICASKEIPA